MFNFLAKYLQNPVADNQTFAIDFNFSIFVDLNLNFLSLNFSICTLAFFAFLHFVHTSLQLGEKIQIQINRQGKLLLQHVASRCLHIKDTYICVYVCVSVCRMQDTQSKTKIQTKPNPNPNQTEPNRTKPNQTEPNQTRPIGQCHWLGTCSAKIVPLRVRHCL